MLVLFKSGIQVSTPVEFINMQYENIKALLKNSYVYGGNDVETAAGLFTGAAAKAGWDLEIKSDRSLSDYFGLTEDYRLFDVDRVQAVAGYADVCLIVLNPTENNVRAMLFESASKRWFTVKR